MRRQIWSAEEIRDVLLATREASGLSQATVAEEDESAKALRAYCQGFKAALISLTIAFGLAPLAGELPSEAEQRCNKSRQMTQVGGMR